MFRRIFITTLVLGAAGSAALSLASMRGTIYRLLSFGPQAQAYVHLSDGLVRAGLILADRPIRIEPHIRNAPRLLPINDSIEIRTMGGDERGLELIFPNRAHLARKHSPFGGGHLSGALQRRFHAPSGSAPTVNVSFVRAPGWLPPLLLLAYPLLSLGLGRGGAGSSRQAGKDFILDPPVVEGPTTSRSNRMGCCGCPCARWFRGALLGAFSLLTVGSLGAWVLSHVPAQTASRHELGEHLVFWQDDSGLACMLTGQSNGLVLSAHQGWAAVHIAWSECKPSGAMHRNVPLGPIHLAVTRHPPNVMYSAEVPLWLSTVVFGAWPGWVLLRAARRRFAGPSRPRRCECCGSHLRDRNGTHCPECGAPR